MHKSLSRLGYILEKEKLDKSEIVSIKKDLTVKPLVIQAFADFHKDVEAYPIYLESPKRFFLPRFYGIEKYGEPKRNLLKSGKKISIQDNISLMDHQLKSFDKTLNHLNTLGGGVLSLPCGAGKTVLALKIIATLKLKTIVIVNKDFLMDQWIERIEQFLPDAKIGIIQQKKLEVEDKDIVIGMIHSISQKDYPKEAFEEFGLAIVDETHHASAKMFSKSLPKIACRYQLGLSATPNRRDGLSYVFYYYLGPLFHSESRTGKNRVIIKQVKIRSDAPNYDVVYKTIRGKQYKNSQAMIGQVTIFHQRNMMIISIIKELIKQGRKILVLSERRDHLEYFNDKLLPKASIRTPENKFATYGLYYGKAPGTNKKDHQKSLEATAKCDIVLGTCAMASEALDIPSLNTLIFATPMTDVEQASGRILRKFHKDLNPMIIDIIDLFGNFEKHGRGREKYFRSEDYIIQTLRMNLSSYPDKNVKDLEKLIEYINDTELPKVLHRPDPRILTQETFDDTAPQNQKTTKKIQIGKTKNTVQKIYSKSLDKVITIKPKPLEKSKHHPETNKGGVCLL